MKQFYFKTFLLVLFLSCFLFVAGYAEAAIVRIQSAKATNTGNSISANWPTATTAGNFLITIIHSTNSDATPNIIPPGGWILAVRRNYGSFTSLPFGTLAIYYKENASSENSTGSFTTGGGNNNIIVAEYSGISTSSALDKTTSNSGTSTAPTTGVTLSTIQPNELLIGVLGTRINTVYSNPINSFTIVNQNNATSSSSALLERIVSATGTYSTGATQGQNGLWAGAIATFKEIPPGTNPIPTLISISPQLAAVGDPSFTLTVNGNNFVPSSVVNWENFARPTTYVSTTQLTAQIPASDLTTAGSYDVTVLNPTPGGGISNFLPFNVSVPNPVPTITSLSPGSTTVGSSSFTLTINGTGFTSVSQVKWDGVNKTTTYVSATQLRATILAADVATTGTHQITVFNPAPGGGTSNAEPFSVNNPTPNISSLSPSFTTVGTQNFKLNVLGTGFLPTSIIYIDGLGLTTTYISSTQIATTFSAVPPRGTYSITVVNPAPGGGTSNAVTFTVNNPTPIVTTLSPTSATVGDPDLSLTVNGSGFVPDSVVNFKGPERTSYVSTTRLIAIIPASDLASAGTSTVTVTNPAPGGGTSNGVNFTVNNPLPSTTSISPSSITGGGPSFTMTVNGSGFVSNSVVQFDGSNRSTTYVSANQLTAIILSSDITLEGTHTIVVFNPTPGGGFSNGQVFTVNPNPFPSTISISPNSAERGTSVLLTVNGSNFVAGSVVKFDGSTRTTTFVSETQLTTTLSSSDTLSVGNHIITVFNPAPGGGTSNGQTFVVFVNPTPAITSIFPNSATRGDPALTLTVNGSNFIASSVVRWAGSNRTTTYVSATQLTAQIPASDLTTAGTFNITVFNPPSGGLGGGSSDVEIFTVNNPVPATLSISPSSAAIGSPGLTLTVNGSGFINTSVVRWNGTNKTTTFVSAAELTATISSSDLLTGGSRDVTVFNPGPGGGVSNPQVFSITNPAPVITSLSPTSATAGSAGFTLTINGSGFINTSVVRWNGSDRTTTYSSSTRLTAQITASDVAVSGTYDVIVVNPSPGGGASNAQLFSVNNPVPTITTISPDAATAGAPDFTLTVNGTGFTQDSSINIQGLAVATTYVSSIRLTTLISPVPGVGTYSITVVNPAPGGGTSNAKTLTINNPLPSITSISPSSAVAGSQGFSLTINGNEFISGSVVRWNGSDRQTTYVSSTQLQAAIPTSDLITPGAYAVTVFNPTPGGGTSNAKTFTVNEVSRIKIIKSTTGGDATFTYNVTGPTPLTSSITTANGIGQDILSPINEGTYNITETSQIDWIFDFAYCYTPGTGTTGTLTANGINNVVVTTGETTTCTFSNNNSTAPSETGLKIIKNTTSGDGTFTYNLSPTPLTSSITTANGIGQDILSPINEGTYNITETSQIDWIFDFAYCYTPGTGTTGTLTANGINNVVVTTGETTTCTFSNTKDNPIPSITSISPSSAVVGSQSLVLTVNGSNFLTSSIVRWNGSDRQTTYVSQTQLTAQVTPADLAVAGTYNITVVNPAPGGGTSNTKTFTVGTNPLPSIQSISPSSAQVGSPGITLTVNGSNFVSSSVVRWSGRDLATIFVSSTQLTSQIPSSDLDTIGTFNVTVMNPSPGGGTSNNVSFSVSAVSNPVPVITTITPNSAARGSAGFTLTVNGSNFVTGSLVKWAGSNRTTTFVSSTQLTAQITSSNVATVGNYAVTVTNPSPGGGTSNAENFTVTESAQLTIVKTTMGGDETFDYNLSPTPLVATITTRDGAGSSGAIILNPDTYTIIETVPGGWTFNEALCDKPYTEVTNGVEVDVTSGSLVTCTFTNTKNDYIPETGLRIIKTTTIGDGTFTYQISDFVTGSSVANTSVSTFNRFGENEVTVGPGTYNIIETLPVGWIFNSVICDQSYTRTANGASEVRVLQDKITTCTFNNSRAGGGGELQGGGRSVPSGGGERVPSRESLNPPY